MNDFVFLIAMFINGFLTVGCVALGAAMFREIRHYRALKARHGANVKRLASKLPMMRTEITENIGQSVTAGKENDALRRLCVALIGYISRLEKEMKSTGITESVSDVLESAPPIIDLTEAIREREWAEFDDILRGIPRAKHSGPRAAS